MDELERIKESAVLYENFLIRHLWKDDIDWLIKEIETLRLDNTYLQQRLQRELEK